MSEQEVAIVFVGGTGVFAQGYLLKRRIALRIDGQDRDVITLTLDSEGSRRRQAKRWAVRFRLDESELVEKLTTAALYAAAEGQRPTTAASSAGGTQSPVVPPHTLDAARPVFQKWLNNTDPLLLDVVFGAVMAHRLDGDPVWLFVVGAPGDGKTEALRSMSEAAVIYMVSTLTPGSLLSGYITEGPDPSLLPKLDGKVLVVKDFTVILEMPNESRQELLGTLRDAYDGEACKAFGTGEVKRYKSRFGLVAAVTPFIDKCWGVNAQLGERFLRIRLPTDGRTEKVEQALQNARMETIMRRELADAALGVLAQKTDAVPEFPAALEASLVSLADFVSLVRSDVARDRQGVVQYIPAPEVGTRCGKALKKLGIGIAMANGLPAVDDQIYAILCRIGMDTVPSIRKRLIRVLWDHRGADEPTAILADAAEVPTDTAKTWLDDLRLLGIVDRGGEQHSGYRWRLRGSFIETIIRAGLFANVEGGADSDPQAGCLADGAVRGTESPPTPVDDDDSDRPERKARMAVEAEESGG